MQQEQSLPSWECGLKSDCLLVPLKKHPVTPFVGVWIEIFLDSQPLSGRDGHSLRGSVD